MRTTFLLASIAAVCHFSVPADAAWLGRKERDVNKFFVFPTIAYPSRLKGEYKIDVHAVALDTGSGDGPAKDSMLRFACGKNKALFNERFAPFVAHVSAGAPVSVVIGKNLRIDLDQIDSNGHTEQILSIAPKQNETTVEMAVTVKRLSENTLTEQMEVPLALPQGWGVISDIDDTIKISQILSLFKLLSRAFCQEYLPVEGMRAFYEYLNTNLRTEVSPGHVSLPVFYYLSGSPWQLLHPIADFISKYFPKGEIILDELNIKCLKGLLFHARDSIEYKKNHIRKIFKKFPERKWLLIGDAGEHDPEIYASIHEEFPEKVCHILIRVVEGTNPAVESQKNADGRFRKTFAKVPESKWSKLTVAKIEEYIAGTDFKVANCGVLPKIA